MLAALVAAPALATAQPGAATRVGVGVRIEPAFVLPNQNGGALAGAAPSFSLPIDVNGLVRIEPEVGFVSNTQESGSSTITARQLAVGLAVGALVPREDVTLTAGARVRYLRFSFEFDGDFGLSDGTVSGFGIGPFVGGEYPFSGRFALGGEAGVEYRGYDFDSENVDASVVTTTAALSVRFFF